AVLCTPSVQPLPPPPGELGLPLDAHEGPPQLQAGDAGRAAAGERVEYPVAGLGGAADDGPQESQGQLRREPGDALRVVVVQPADGRVNAPDVIPDLPPRVDPGITQAQAGRRPPHRAGAEAEPPRPPDEVQQSPR